MGDSNNRGRSAGVSPAVLGASRPRFGEVRIRDRGRLPHWELEAGTYFVTFRLKDSLPLSVIQKIQSEVGLLQIKKSQTTKQLTSAELNRLNLLQTFRLEKYLDSGTGACYLKNPELANLVCASLKHFENKRYRLFAWCVMPNHVHVVMKLFPDQQLGAIVHSWKSFSAKRANKILGSNGAFWDREYYDHLVRNPRELDRIVRYVANNPVKAGLLDWKWMEACGQDARTTAGETPALQKADLP
jgi:REP element-mobilizing transposase RayT